MSATALLSKETPLTNGQGWRLEVFDHVPSTNSCASQLPAWSAVRAVTQSAGRGRAARHWVSDEGGLWLSAVVPCPGSRKKWEILPLAAGWAILGALRELGVSEPRLRWPNDILVGRGKLAGLLVERFTNDTAVIGVGLNLSNRPEWVDPSLAGLTARLDDLVDGAYTVEDVTESLLRAFRGMHTHLIERGFYGIADDLNRAWKRPRRVEITLNGGAAAFHGFFQGIDPYGRLCLVTENEGLRLYDANQVALLRELE